MFHRWLQRGAAGRPKRQSIGQFTRFRLAAKLNLRSSAGFVQLVENGVLQQAAREHAVCPTFEQNRHP